MDEKEAQVSSEIGNIMEKLDENNLNEDKLQDITGGCLGCLALGTVATVEGANSLAKGQVFGSGKEIRRGATQALIGLDSLLHTSPQVRPCMNCATNAVLYAATKSY